MDKQDTHLADLTQAARRAGSIVDEHINSIVDLAERRADEIRRSAERDAEATRREAVESARRVFERINALEHPLGELVQTLQSESQRVERELGGHVDAEVAEIPSGVEEPSTDGDDLLVEDRSAGPGIHEVAAVEEEAPTDLTGRQRRGQEREQERAERRARREQERVERESAERAEAQRQSAQEAERESAATAEREARAAHTREETARAAAPVEEPVADGAAPAPAEDGAKRTSEPQPIPVPAAFEPAAEEPKRGLLSRLRGGKRKQSAFISTPGHCAVCQKTFMAGSEENLRLSGWKVSGEVGLCPEDQRDGWQLPEGARLPFRRGGG